MSTLAAMRARSERARKARAAAHKRHVASRIEWIRTAERLGDVFTLPSGVQVRIFGSRAVLYGFEIGLQPSGRLKYYELDGCRVAPGALTSEDRAALAQELRRRKVESRKSS